MKKQLAIAVGVLFTLGTAVSASLNDAAQPTEPVVTGRFGRDRNWTRSRAHRLLRCGTRTRIRLAQFRWRVHFELSARRFLPSSLPTAASFRSSTHNTSDCIHGRSDQQHRSIPME